MSGGGRTKWVLLGLLFCSTVINYLDRQALSILATTIQADLRMSDIEYARVVQVFPSTGSLVRLAGAVMCEQDEIWQESRYFSEVRMNELYDDGRTRGIDGPVDWARLEAEARKMLESGLELADRVEAA